jgi:hypothetical protein
MPNQEQSPSGKPGKDADRPSPDVRGEADGQAAARSGNGASRDRDYRGDGPGKIGVTSDKQPDLVAPSGVNERDHGAAGEAPMAGDMLNFDDDEVMSGRGNNERTGGTWDAKGADSGKLAPPGEIMSDRNGPSDPDRGAGKNRS